MIVNSQSQQVAQSGEHLRCQTGKTIIIKCPNGNKVSCVISNCMHMLQAMYTWQLTHSTLSELKPLNTPSGRLDIKLVYSSLQLMKICNLLYVIVQEQNNY